MMVRMNRDQMLLMCILVGSIWTRIVMGYPTLVPSARDVAASFGYNYIKELFSDEKILMDAIDHKWESISPLLFDLENNQHHRNRHQDRRLDASDKKGWHRFLSCSIYDFAEVQHVQRLRERNYTVDIVYNSATDGKFCFVLSLDLYSFSSSNAENDRIFPSTMVAIPDILKVHRALHRSLDLHLDQDELKKKSDLNTNMSLIPRRSSVVEESFTAGEALELVAMFRRGTTLEAMKATVSRWSQLLLDDSKQTSMRHSSFERKERTVETEDIMESIWENIYWTRTSRTGISTSSDYSRSALSSHARMEAKSTKPNYSYQHWLHSRQRRLNGAGIDISDSLSVRIRRQTSHDDLIKVSHSQRLNVWNRRRQLAKDLRTTQVLSAHCGWAMGLHTRYRRDSVHVVLSPEIMHDTIHGYHNSLSKSAGASDTIDQEELPRLRGTCLSILSSLLASEEVVEHVVLNKPMKTTNNFARGIMQSGSVSSEPYIASGLDGTGIIIGVSDTGIDRYHCSFRDDQHGLIRDGTIDNPYFDLKYRKVIQYINYASSSGDYKSGHGSHVSGTLAGMPVDQSSQHFKGMAPSAKLAFFDIGYSSPPGSLAVPYNFVTQLFPPAYIAGARIHSNSWGGNYWYDSFSIETDEFMYNFPDMIGIFAGGNDGANGRRTVLSPAIAKNALAIAASDTTHVSGQDIGNLATFSSTGPAPDGRIKPDIAAPGNAILSASSNGEFGSTSTCQFVQKMGTSMATPVTAGTAALVQQYFNDYRFWAAYCLSTYPKCSGGSFFPLGSTVKAILIQSGVQMKLYNGAGKLRQSLGQTPDTFQGFGRVNLHNVLPLVSAAPTTLNLFVDENTLSSFTEILYLVEITDISKVSAFRATLAWYDPPNTVFSAQVVLHDLDLVVSKDNVVYYGNAPRASNGSPGSTDVARDELNNVEQVIVSAAGLSLGTWSVRVQAKLLTESVLQNFSLVLTMAGHVIFSEGVSPIRQDISQSILQCASDGLVPMHVAMFALTSNAGWATDDLLSISSGGVVKFSESFTEHQPYKVTSACIEPGSFNFGVNFKSTTKAGSMASIPQCSEVFVAPLVPSVNFFVSGNVINRSCSSECDTLNNKRYLNVFVYESGGEGWYGGYYSIQKIVGTTVQPLSAGTLEGNFYEFRSLCLPTPAAGSTQCYWMHLSLPSSSNYDYFPEVYFADAVLVDSNGIATNIDCSRYLRYNESYSTICVKPNGDMEITFYAQPSTPRNNDWVGFGQSLPSAATISTVFDTTNLQYLGTCTVVAEVPSPSAQPTVLPTRNPSRAPTLIPSARPSVMPSFRPSLQPSLSPTVRPSKSPTELPTIGIEINSFSPDSLPTSLPSTSVPTSFPTSNLVKCPTSEPSSCPSTVPTLMPSASDIPTALPSSPSARPSGPPVSRRPTASPSMLLDPFDSHDFVCFEYCENFPGVSIFQRNMESVFDFFFELLNSCSTFDLALGLCPLPECASNCSISTWCYFASGTAMSDEYWQPVSHNLASQTLNSSCILAMTSDILFEVTLAPSMTPTVLSSIPNHGSSQTTRIGASATLVLAVIIFSLAVAIYLVRLAKNGVFGIRGDVATFSRVNGEVESPMHDISTNSVGVLDDSSSPVTNISRFVIDDDEESEEIDVRMATDNSIVHSATDKLANGDVEMATIQGNRYATSRSFSPNNDGGMGQDYVHSPIISSSQTISLEQGHWTISKASNRKENYSRLETEAD